MNRFELLIQSLKEFLKYKKFLFDNIEIEKYKVWRESIITDNNVSLTSFTILLKTWSKENSNFSIYKIWQSRKDKDFYLSLILRLLVADYTQLPYVIQFDFLSTLMFKSNERLLKREMRILDDLVKRKHITTNFILLDENTSDKEILTQMMIFAYRDGFLKNKVDKNRAFEIFREEQIEEHREQKILEIIGNLFLYIIKKPDLKNKENKNIRKKYDSGFLSCTRSSFSFNSYLAKVIKGEKEKLKKEDFESEIDEVSLDEMRNTLDYQNEDLEENIEWKKRKKKRYSTYIKDEYPIWRAAELLEKRFDFKKDFRGMVYRELREGRIKKTQDKKGRLAIDKKDFEKLVEKIEKKELRKTERKKLIKKLEQKGLSYQAAKRRIDRYLEQKLSFEEVKKKIMHC